MVFSLLSQADQNQHQDGDQVREHLEELLGAAGEHHKLKSILGQVEGRDQKGAHLGHIEVQPREEAKEVRAPDGV